MAMECSNIFRNEKLARPEEVIQTLVNTSGLRLERIVSNGSATLEGEWYDQRTAEWVILLAGKARLRFEQPDTEIELSPGDYLNIPAHRRHRVEWTTPDEPTLWLALHYVE